jgi:N-acetylglucosamine-6-phosphate deacetylase
VENSSIRFEDGQIVAVEAGRTAGDGVLDAGDGIVIPGLVDLQVNGALGWSFQSHHRDHFDAIIDFHRGRGTTTLLPTLITAPVETLTTSLACLADYLDAAPAVTLPGIHLEGPFLSPQKSGAHDPAALRLPDLDTAEEFIAAAGGRISIFTIAPELAGALPVIEWLAGQGIVVSAGHTAATYADMKRAMAAGLSSVTHAGNASDWPHRAPGPLGFMASEPGIVGTLLAEPSLTCGVILDGFHFHPALLSPLVTVKGADHVVLVSDASTIAGSPPGYYESGGIEVTVHREGFATSGRGGGWLAGSTITLLDAVQRAVGLAGLPLHTAVHMATLAPARFLGLDARKGDLAPGRDADLLVLNPDLSLRHVIVGGEMIERG